MKFDINIDEQTASAAAAIYAALGLDTETAIGMFLKRTVLEQGLPLKTDVPASAVPSLEQTNTPRGNSAITKTMAEDIWKRFVNYLSNDGDINSIAADAHTATGMNEGSAFIYLVILNNLVHGKPNSRNMKMADLEYYVTQIREELGEESYQNALESLKRSIPYWNKGVFGQFADRVTHFVEAIESGEYNPPSEVPKSERNILPITLSPTDPEEFKRKLIASGKGRIRTYYTDGTFADKDWNASKINKDSSIIGNLRSRVEFRSGEWQKRGIARVEVKAL